METPTIIGLHGCYCHPYESWEECEAAHKQKLPVGTPVKNRHSGLAGTVHTQEDSQGFNTVRYGDRPCDIHLEHVANLIKL